MGAFLSMSMAISAPQSVKSILEAQGRSVIEDAVAENLAAARRASPASLLSDFMAEPMAVEIAGIPFVVSVKEVRQGTANPYAQVVDIEYFNFLSYEFVSFDSAQARGYTKASQRFHYFVPYSTREKTFESGRRFNFWVSFHDNHKNELWRIKFKIDTEVAVEHLEKVLECGDDIRAYYHPERAEKEAFVQKVILGLLGGFEHRYYGFLLEHCNQFYVYDVHPPQFSFEKMRWMSSTEFNEIWQHYNAINDDAKAAGFRYFTTLEDVLAYGKTNSFEVIVRRGDSAQTYNFRAQQ